ncbi:hypothetical protein FQN49_006219 [Arthroderma sp. PD_2]|nr:hypothetical protein FQN49_006219 [Arthroderma sp. PD_2]
MASITQNAPSDSIKAPPMLNNADEPSSNQELSKKFDPKQRQFILILLSLCLIALVVSLDITSVAIALPRISTELQSQENYVWVANCFVFAQTAIQLVCGQVCDIFGRRTPMIISVVIFAIGSAVAGAASTTAALIAGRTIQGLGAGGINVLVELILCDLVPLSERAKYFGIVLSVTAIGTMAGPVIGGVLAEANWRWIFYLNLPVTGIVLVSVIFFLPLQHGKNLSWARTVRRMDWIGYFLSIGSICAILFGLVSGGVVYSWLSWRTIFPIALGLTGWITFHWYENSKFCKEPSIPPRLFLNRTAVSGFYMAFISSTLLIWVCYFWPVYFQGLHDASPMKAGIYILPFAVFLIPVSIVSGIALGKIGAYRPIHFIGFSLSFVGLGLNTLLRQNTTVAAWVMFQIVDASGRGALFPTILPAILASLPESDTATATGMYAFLRSFGFVWGVTIPSIIFNASFDRYAFQIKDHMVRQNLTGGRAYASVGSYYVKSLPAATKSEVISTYVEALKIIWIAAIAFSATGFLFVFVEKEIPLRTELNTEYGLELETKKSPAGV